MLGEYDGTRFMHRTWTKDMIINHLTRTHNTTCSSLWGADIIIITLMIDVIVLDILLLSACRVHFSTPNVALKYTYQKKKRPLGSPKPHTSPDHVFSVAFIVVILVLPYKNNGNCDLSYPRLKSPYTPDKTIICFVTRIAKLSRNHGSSFVKSELSLPWNP